MSIKSLLSKRFTIVYYFVSIKSLLSTTLRFKMLYYFVSIKSLLSATLRFTIVITCQCLYFQPLEGLQLLYYFVSIKTTLRFTIVILFCVNQVFTFYHFKVYKFGLLIGTRLVSFKYMF